MTKSKSNPESHKPSRFQFFKDGKIPVGSFMLTALQDDRFADHARWIAIIVSLWSLIESQLEMIYGRVLNLDTKRTKIAFYAIQNYHARRNIISAMISEFHAGSNAEVTWIALQEELKSAYGYRNTVAHGLWERHPHGPLRLQSTVVDGRFIQIDKPYQAAAFEQQALQMSKLAASLNDLTVMLYGFEVQQPTSP